VTVVTEQDFLRSALLPTHLWAVATMSMA
jgi:hypothetical protein